MGDWRIALIEAHPQIFGAFPGKGAASRAYPRCGDGWRDLLERACATIESAITGGDTFVAREISQRLGTLRFCWSGKLKASSQTLIAEAVCRAEACSHCTCEECGAPGRLYRAGKFLRTRCFVHAIGVLVPIEPGLENVHLVQKTVDGRASIAACRYDRATDAFIEIAWVSNKDEVPGRHLEDVIGPRSESDWLRCTSQGARLRAFQRRNHCRGRRQRYECRR